MSYCTFGFVQVGIAINVGVRLRHNRASMVYRATQRSYRHMHATLQLQHSLRGKVFILAVGVGCWGRDVHVARNLDVGHERSMRYSRWLIVALGNDTSYARLASREVKRACTHKSFFVVCVSNQLIYNISEISPVVARHASRCGRILQHTGPWLRQIGHHEVAK